MPDPRRLHILTLLRKRARISLAEMARACGLVGNRGYESASAWECGLSTPHSQVRISFALYLAHTLDLAADHTTLKTVWSVLVSEWNWESLQAADWLMIDRRVEPEPGAISTSTPNVTAEGKLFQHMPTSGGLPEPGLLPLAHCSVGLC